MQGLSAAGWLVETIKSCGKSGHFLPRRKLLCVKLPVPLCRPGRGDRRWTFSSTIATIVLTLNVMLMQEVRQGRREVEVREERRGTKGLLGEDGGTGLLQLGNSSYSSTYVRGKRVVEKGKEGKTKWGIGSSSSSSSVGSQDHLEDGFSKEHHHGSVSRECKCRFREEEKAALQKLNLRHRELVDARDKKIKALQRKLDSLTTFKEEFVKEERWKTEEQVRLLQEEIAEMKQSRSEEMIDEASRKAELEEQKRRLREAESMLARREDNAATDDDDDTDNDGDGDGDSQGGGGEEGG